MSGNTWENFWNLKVWKKIIKKKTKNIKILKIILNTKIFERK